MLCKSSIRRDIAAVQMLLLITPKQKKTPEGASLLAYHELEIKSRYPLLLVFELFLADKLTKAVTACSASEPSALIVTSVPELIARLIMPMMILH